GQGHRTEAGWASGRSARQQRRRRQRSVASRRSGDRGHRMARSTMAKLAVFLLVLSASFAAAAQRADDAGRPIVNPAIDPAAFLRVAGVALAERERHRVSEAEFVRMRREPRTVVLDARSKEKYDELHV